MTSHVLLRPAEQKDCKFLWRLRNEKETRRWSFNQDYIPYENHKNWFQKRLNNADSKILIVLDENRKEIGQIRFDIDDDKSAEVSIGIDSKARNKGYGSTALKLACQYAIENFNIIKVIARIKEENLASIKAFTKAGFIKNGEYEFRA